MSMRLPPLSLKVTTASFPISGAFTISRGSKTEAVVVTASVSDGAQEGHGECVPYARYGETVESVAALIESQAPFMADGTDRDTLQTMLPPGAARNALDCALWDFEAKASNQRVWARSDLPAPDAVPTCFTISLGAPQEMYKAAREAAQLPLLKIKLGGDGDAERIAAVRAGAPDARLVVDANESWTEANFAINAAACASAGAELIEQPFPAADDGALRHLTAPIPICADESAHACDGLAAITDRYQAVNIKLDKTGGLTEAIAMVREAQKLGLEIMVGCMVGTSLSMAPAMLLSPFARWVDLDGPMLLAKDRPNGLDYSDGVVRPPEPALWG